MMHRSNDFRLWERDMAAHDYSSPELAAVATGRGERVRWFVAQLGMLAVVLAVAFVAGYSIGMVM